MPRVQSPRAALVVQLRGGGFAGAAAARMRGAGVRSYFACDYVRRHREVAWHFWSVSGRVGILVVRWPDYVPPRDEHFRCLHAGFPQPAGPGIPGVTHYWRGLGFEIERDVPVVPPPRGGAFVSAPAIWVVVPHGFLMLLMLPLPGRVDRRANSIASPNDDRPLSQMRLRPPRDAREMPRVRGRARAANERRDRRPTGGVGRRRAARRLAATAAGAFSKTFRGADLPRSELRNVAVFFPLQPPRETYRPSLGFRTQSYNSPR